MVISIEPIKDLVVYLSAFDENIPLYHYEKDVSDVADNIERYMVYSERLELLGADDKIHISIPRANVLFVDNKVNGFKRFELLDYINEKYQGITIEKEEFDTRENHFVFELSFVLGGVPVGW